MLFGVQSISDFFPMSNRVSMRWRNYCGMEHPYLLDRMSKVYKCKNNNYKFLNTGKYFNVKTGTIFENSKISLRKWFVAIWMFTSNKCGISSCELSRQIDVTQKTAWFMLHCIRKSVVFENNRGLAGEVEMDETYVGGLNKNRHADKKVKHAQGRSGKDKTPVFGMVERGGRVVANVITSNGNSNSNGYIFTNKAEICTIDDVSKCFTFTVRFYCKSGISSLLIKNIADTGYTEMLNTYSYNGYREGRNWIFRSNTILEIW